MKYYSTKEASELLGISPWTIRRLIHNGEIKYKVANYGVYRKRFLIPEDEVEKIRRIIEESLSK